MLRLDAPASPLARAVSLATALALAGAAGLACGSDDEPTGRRSSGGDLPADAGGTSATSDAARTCDGLALETHPRPACDQCAKSKCCDKVLACADSDDCKALQECLAPCADDDIVCIQTCQILHDKGSDALLEVGSCVRARCASECPSSTPDAGPDPFE